MEGGLLPNCDMALTAFGLLSLFSVSMPWCGHAAYPCCMAILFISALPSLVLYSPFFLCHSCILCILPRYSLLSPRSYCLYCVLFQWINFTVCCACRMPGIQTFLVVILHVGPTYLCTNPILRRLRAFCYVCVGHYCC